MLTTNFTLPADDAELAKLALRRFSRAELHPAEVALEVERLDQRVRVLRTYTASTARKNALEYYERELDEATDLLRRLTVSRVNRPMTVMPDFSRARLADLVGLAETLGYHPRKSGRNYTMSCPFHDGDRDPSLVIYPPGQGWHCFGCGKGGADAASFAAEHYQCSQVEGLRWVEELCDVP